MVQALLHSWCSLLIDKQLASPWGINTDDYRKGPFQPGEVPLDKAEIIAEGCS